MTHTAVLALGSNLDSPEQQVRHALLALAEQAEITVQAVSPFYRSRPVGYANQPDFVNAVCIVETTLTGLELLARLNQIEAQFGRVRTFRNAPRTLDLDIIDYNGEQSSDPVLTLPHPRAHERAFVMQPLADIAPDFMLGSHGRASELAASLGSDGLELLANP